MNEKANDYRRGKRQLSKCFDNRREVVWKGSLDLNRSSVGMGNLESLQMEEEAAISEPLHRWAAVEKIAGDLMLVHRQMDAYLMPHSRFRNDRNQSERPEPAIWRYRSEGRPCFEALGL